MTQTVFQPYTFNNGITVKNRLAVAPMTHFASDDNGHITAQERAFLQNRFNGFGLFIAAATLVQLNGKTFQGQPYAMSEDDLPSLREVAQIAQAQGAKAILQIHHGGKLAIKDLCGEIVAPSADQETGARELTEAEIEQLIAAYGNAARLAIQAGFDGVEIHGANGYILQQFFSAQSNRRADQWGGSLKNRLRFPLAVVDAVTAAVKDRPDFIIGYRFSPEEADDNGITMADTFELMDALLQKPLQYLHVSLHDFYKKARRGADENRTRIEQLHEHIGGKLPLIGVGNLYTGNDIQKAFTTGWAEFIGLGKTVMINPNLVDLIQANREADIQTELDPNRADHYRLPDALWQRCLNNSPWLPPVKGMERQTLDV